MAHNTGWKTPGTIANVDRSGGPAWSTPTNADTLNNAYATVSITDAQNFSDYLRASNFGFALPTDATILGIEVRVFLYGSDATLDDDEVLLYDAAGSIGTENRAANSIMSSKKGTAKFNTYGSPTDLWADTWTEANVEDTDFGFAFSAGNIGSSTETCSLNVMQMRVWYDEGLKSNWNRRVKITLDSAAIDVGIHSNVIFQLGTQNGVALTGSFPSEMVDLDGSTPMDTAGADLRITKDIDGLVPLHFFIERIELDNDPAESDVSIWLLAPTVPSGEDYEFYLWYDHSTAVAPAAEFQADVWDDWLWVHMFGVTVSGATVVPDESKFALDTTMAEVGSGSSFSRVDSNSYLGGFAYDINSLNGTNFIRGTYDTAVSEQLMTNYDTNIPPTWTKVFLGTLRDNVGSEGYCLGACNIFNGETTATWAWTAGGGATAAVNVTNDGDGAPVNPHSTGKGNTTVFVIGNQLGEDNYRANVVAPNPVADNAPLCAFGKLTAACGLSLYANGGVLGNCDNYFHTNLDVDYFSVIIPRDLDMQIFHNAYGALNEGGADCIADFAGTCFVALTLGWHRTFYEEVINQSTHITVGTPGGTDDIVSVSIAGVTEGTPVKFIANETVGSITIGDVLAEGFADNTGLFGFSLSYEGAFNPSGLDVLIRARNQGVAVAAIAEDGGVFTDETEEASTNATDDMTLLPATPVANDAYNLGHSAQFSRLKLNISQVLTESSPPTLVWEYWNGAWVALSGVIDGTNGLENAGENIVSWTIPGDWATTTINSQGPLYYVRVRLTVAGTITQVPIGARVVLDTPRYIPFVNEIAIPAAGLATAASWVPDNISKFDPDD